MAITNELVLVLGATGQQGGGSARALKIAGFRVRALVRDTQSARAQALAAQGIELVRGDLRDRDSLARAIEGVYGVFSVQPSSGQPEYGVSDADELAFGTSVAELAKTAGVSHFVYSSVGGLRPNTGVGHFESKWQIEQYVHKSGLPATVVRPTAFMELLLAPHFGLPQRALLFFLLPGRTMQFIAANDIGRLVAHIFSHPDKYIGQTLELAGDELTGEQLADAISCATGTPVSYARFSEAFLDQVPVLRRVIEAVDQGDAVGNADIPALRREVPGLLTFEDWLAHGGANAIRSLWD